ncbi:3-methyl-2-oxobutanoate hydroxymethyltransferase [Pseudomonas syringae pv. aptata]|nr:3-methyl-2-oxobutanoate hydroxymethyltransferase [Pseudomonas syringae pv. aptata]
MPNITVTSLLAMKQKGEKITMLTCYDATFAHTASQAGVEVLLIGDSLGMVLQGHDSTLPVTTAETAYHVACVKRGNQGAMILADLPFMANATLEQTLINSATLMQAGAHMIKVEGAAWLAESIRLLAERGIPVCAHMGLTPQAVNVLGGYKVQGRLEAQARQMRADAIALEQAGAAMILLECVPSELAEEITQAVKVPVIGIGAWQRHRRPGPGAARHARPVHHRTRAQVREKFHDRSARYPVGYTGLRGRSQRRQLSGH